MLKVLFSQKVGVFGSSILSGFSDKKKNRKRKRIEDINSESKDT